MHKAHSHLVLAVFMILCVSWSLALAQEPADNTGQDFTRPTGKLELGVVHMDMIADAWSESIVAKASLPCTLEGLWKASISAEQPYTWIKGATRKNPYGRRLKGFSEVVLEGLVIAPPEGGWTWAAGAQWIPPSASRDELGTGRHQLVPTIGARYDLGGWMQGAWCGARLGHAFDVAGYEGYPHISQTVFQPMLNIDLPGSWFLTFSPEARYDWKNEEWFIPFDITAGKLAQNGLVVLFTYRSAINDDMLLYVNTFELRVRYLFDADVRTILSGASSAVNDVLGGMPMDIPEPKGP